MVFGKEIFLYQLKIMSDLCLWKHPRKSEQEIVVTTLRI